MISQGIPRRFNLSKRKAYVPFLFSDLGLKYPDHKKNKLMKKDEQTSPKKQDCKGTGGKPTKAGPAP